MLCVIPCIVTAKLELFACDNSIVSNAQEDSDHDLLVCIEHLVDIELLEVFDDILRVQVPVQNPPVRSGCS